ncbi:MAG: hypothetical protein IJQ31_14335 [Thermoguttaceae bacterium]|nr:hypothetical protein [Thermoguttaceae bacterium]
MRSIVVFFSLLLSASFLFAEDDPEAKAREYWDKMPDHTTPELLDEFITQYPHTQTAKLAFLTRYFLLTENPSIDGYNNFLEQYPDTVQSDCALQAVFNLCRDYNTVPLWLDFLARYPDTIQGVAAKLHLETLLANYAFACDDEKTFDDYIEVFPDAPQIPGMIERAAQLALKREEDFKAEILKTYENDYNQCENELKKSATKLVSEWQTWHSDLGREKASSGMDVTQNGRAFLLLAKIRRYETIILNLYGQYPAAMGIRSEVRHQELLMKLDSIQQTLLDNHKELVSVIREESEKTRQTLREEFAKLGYKMDTGFNMLAQKMDVLHSDLENIYSELQKVNMNLENIQSAVLESNKLLAKIDEDLNNTNALLVDMNKTLVDLNGDMNQQFSNLISEVHDFRADTVTRMDVIIKRQEDSLQLQNEQLKVSYETLGVTKDIRSQNDQLIGIAQEQLNSLGRIENNQVAQLNELVGMRSDIRDGFTEMNQTMAAGFESVNNSIYNVGNTISGEISQMNQNMVAGFGQLDSTIKTESQRTRQEMGEGFGRLDNTIRTESQRTRQEMGEGFGRLDNTIKAESQRTRQEMGEGFNRLDNTIRTESQQTRQQMAEGFNSVIQSNQATIASIQQAQQSSSSGGGNIFSSIGKGLKKVAGKTLGVAGTAVGACFGGPAGAAIGGAIGNAAGKAIEGGNRKEILGAAAGGAVSGVVGGVGGQALAGGVEKAVAGGNRKEIFSAAVGGALSAKTGGTNMADIPYSSSSQIFDQIVKTGTTELKDEVRNQIQKNLPAETVPLIESMIQTNLAGQKQKAIGTMAELGLKMNNNDVQNLLNSKSMQDVYQNIEQISQRNGKKPAAVKYAINIF